MRIWALKRRNAELEAALRDVREDICREANTVIFRPGMLGTTVDHICATLRDEWTYDWWLDNRDKNLIRENENG